MRFIKSFQTITPDRSIKDAIKIITDKDYFGLLVVLDDKKFIGIINDGDILRFISNSSENVLDNKIDKFINRAPITINKKDLQKQDFSSITNQLIKKFKNKKHKLRFCPVLANSTCIGVIDFDHSPSFKDYLKESIEIHGLGFVGLTLAAHLASHGFKTVGIDTNSRLVNSLKKSKIEIFEDGLEGAIKQSVSIDKLNFRTSPLVRSKSKVKIICVGSSINKSGKLDDSSIREVCKTISKNIEFGDLIIFRSTVPVGFTREKCIKWLVSEKALKPGVDFNVAFCPERTAEGVALRELKTLTQIVGGLTEECSKRARNFWIKSSKSVEIVESLEAAELVKLANNSFRDLIFGFSNSFSLLCDKYNIDSHDLIKSANHNYPRDLIPSPSPGVGGYCLTKDPLLYASQNSKLNHSKLSRIGRTANKEAGDYPKKILMRYLSREKARLEDIKVLIVGLSFKGNPETNDLRGSDALRFANFLKEKVTILDILDYVVSEKEISDLGLGIYKKRSSNIKYDCIFILNNHKNNSDLSILSSLKPNGLFFDGWKQFSKDQIEQNFIYSSMGYITP